MKKKLIALFAVMTAAAALAACGGKSGTTAKPAATTAAAKPAETEAEAEEEAEEEESGTAAAGGLILYQYDKDNMDVEYEEDGESLEDLEKYGDVTKVTDNGMTFYAVDNDGEVSYYINKEDYKKRLTEVDVNLDNFDQYFELHEEESWDDEGVKFIKYFQLKDDYLFAMVDYDHLYDNTAEATCRPIDYVSVIDVDNKTYDWGIYDVRHDEIETWIDFSDTEDFVYKNVIVSTYPENYIEVNSDSEDNGAIGLAHEDVTLTDVSIKFYYLK